MANVSPKGVQKVSACPMGSLSLKTPGCRSFWLNTSVVPQGMRPTRPTTVLLIIQSQKSCVSQCMLRCAFWRGLTPNLSWCLDAAGQLQPPVLSVCPSGTFWLMGECNGSLYPASPWGYISDGCIYFQMPLPGWSLPNHVGSSVWIIWSSVPNPPQALYCEDVHVCRSNVTGSSAGNCMPPSHTLLNSLTLLYVFYYMSFFCFFLSDLYPL